MPFQRYRFDISTDTGTSALQSGDTGKVPVYGEIMQIRWAVQGAFVDTGADIYVALCPKEADTGDGFQVLSRNDILGANRTWLIGNQMVHNDAFDTGATTEGRFVAAGERLRIKVLPGQAECRGRLYVYVKN